jgi:hypothetical protein
MDNTPDSTNIELLYTNTNNFTTPMCTIINTNQSILSNRRWVICIDVSGSTNDKLDDSTVLAAELKLAKMIVHNFDPEHQKLDIIKWDTNATKVTDRVPLNDFSPQGNLNSITTNMNGGTKPMCIFNHQDVIRSADVLVIMTDGKIEQKDVTDFGQAMTNFGCHLIAVVGVVVGACHNITDADAIENARKVNHPSWRLIPPRRRTKPSDIDVSVLVPAMISNACILYYDSTNIYVMWANGCFVNAFKHIEINDKSKWEDITVIQARNLGNVVCDVCDPMQVLLLRDKFYVPIGNSTFFNLNNFLLSVPSFDSLIAIPPTVWGWICQYCKVNNRFMELYSWFKQQNERLISELGISNNDKDSFNELMTQMIQNRNSMRNAMHDAMHDAMHNANHMTRLSSSYISMRNQRIGRRYIASDEDIETRLNDQRAVQLIRFFRVMLQILDEDAAILHSQSSAIRGSVYSTGIISSSRYSSAHISTNVSNTSRQNITNVLNNITDSSKDALRSPNITANFMEPYLWQKQLTRLYTTTKFTTPDYECSICCETSLPCILIRNIINVSDVNLMLQHLQHQQQLQQHQHQYQPFRYFYPHLVCAKCADCICQDGKDPFRCSCIAALPLIHINELNDKDRSHYLMMFNSMVIDLDVTSICDPISSVATGFNADTASESSQLAQSRSSIQTQNKVMNRYLSYLINFMRLVMEKSDEPQKSLLNTFIEKCVSK